MNKNRIDHFTWLYGLSAKLASESDKLGTQSESFSLMFGIFIGMNKNM